MHQNKTTLIIAVTIVIIVGNVYSFLNKDPVFNVSAEGEDKVIPLKGLADIAANKSLKARVSGHGFVLIADLAITDEQREKGLAVKDQLKENEGMLFIFKELARHSFWMKDMKFPIDIIWLDGNGKVVHVEDNLKPCASVFNCHIYDPNTNSQYVLETVAGFAQKHEISLGTNINIKPISQ